MEEAGAEVEVGEAEFRINNFAATCEVTQAISDGRTNYREIVSGPLIKLHNIQFAIGVSWGCLNEGQKDTSKNLGVFVCKLNSHVPHICTKLQIDIVNREPSQNKKCQDTDFVRWNRGAKAQGWSPSFGDGRRSVGLSMAEVLDENRGWLHENALRIRAKIHLVHPDACAAWANAPKEATCGESQVCDDLKVLLLSGNLSDITIKAGEELIPAHMAILAARSPVFLGMLSSPMRESREREVTVEDLTPDSIRSLLSYIYTGSVEKAVLAEDNAAKGLLQAAHRFQIKGLVRECADALISRLNTENAVAMLECADFFGCEDFKGPCLKFIHANLAAVQSTDGYEKLADTKPGLLKDIIAAMTPPASKAPKPSPDDARGTAL